MRLPMILASVLVWMALGAQTATAQSAGAFPCGRVTAYAAPTATTAGSITLGTSRFELAPGSAPEREISVGSDLCLEGQRNATGAFTRVTVIPMGPGVCGNVVAYSAPTATAAGSITLSSAAGTFRILVAPGVSLSREQTSGGQCFGWRVNGDGNAEIFRYSGVWEGAAAAPSGSGGGLPSTSVASSGPSAPGSLEQQSPAGQSGTPGSAAPTGAAWLGLAAAAALLAAVGLAVMIARRTG